MKRYYLIGFMLISSIFPKGMLAQISFTAEVNEWQQGKHKTYKLYSNGQQYRYDIDDQNMKGAVIVNPELDRTSILIIDSAFVHHTDLFSMQSLSNDPYQAMQYAKSRYEEHNLGKDNIMGFDVDVLEYESRGQKVYKVWYAPKLNFFVKMENLLSKDTRVVLKNIKTGKVDESLFIVPNHYTEVDERMRVKIPEPPPPTEWEQLTMELPVSMELKRGQSLHFTVNYSEYTRFDLQNTTNDPTKVVWYIYRNGQLLGNEEQGPVSYRSKRLMKGEQKKLTYSWKKEDQIKIECHEGVVQVGIMPESKAVQ